ncbi:hypothetical protein BDA96_01G351700 [Sorghum bicolor]|uniref:Uncharacterized protein n=1 Tax=Sorghum bicolor TaxID=4558 RepID=A0A921S218_SORBI|nr:hypothetical protein BDA96_01G351700 [Sorghum bicolor]
MSRKNVQEQSHFVLYILEARKIQSVWKCAQSVATAVGELLLTRTCHAAAFAMTG